jgi:hypothetical protein
MDIEKIVLVNLVNFQSICERTRISIWKTAETKSPILANLNFGKPDRIEVPKKT